ncbi:MAG: ribosome maturation factor RimM [Aureispira sp.]
MEYLEIGKIKKPHGLNGELKATIDERFFEDVNGVEAFFVAINGEKAPYFIESLRGGSPILLKFEDIDSKEDAALFTNKRIYLREEDVSLSEEEIQDTGLEYSFLEGFTLEVEELGVIGAILRVEEFPQQEMATVMHQEKELFIPLLEQWIVRVDKDKKAVVMALPEGLLDI